MSRYYFDLRDRRVLFVDEEGFELRSLEAAQAEAAGALADMARDAIRSDTHDPARQMGIEVRDDAGLVLQVRFSFEIERKRTSTAD